MAHEAGCCLEFTSHSIVGSSGLSFWRPMGRKFESRLRSQNKSFSFNHTVENALERLKRRRQPVNMFDGQEYHIEMVPNGRQDKVVPESLRTILRQYLRPSL